MTKIEDSYHLRIEHLRCVYSDPEFKERCATLQSYPFTKQLSREDALVIKAYAEICLDYMLVFEEVYGFVMRGNIIDDKLYVSSVMYEQAGTSVVYVDRQATKEDYMAEWESIVEARRIIGISPKKRKGTYNYELVYAIFRAKKKFTFKQIFAKYKDGKLPLYTGSTDPYKSEDSLENFYRKYAPTT